jgi:hypothetical protein
MCFFDCHLRHLYIDVFSIAMFWKKFPVWGHHIPFNPAESMAGRRLETGSLDNDREGETARSECQVLVMMMVIGLRFIVSLGTSTTVLHNHCFS